MKRFPGFNSVWNNSYAPDVWRATLLPLLALILIRQHKIEPYSTRCSFVGTYFVCEYSGALMSKLPRDLAKSRTSVYVCSRKGPLGQTTACRASNEHVSLCLSSPQTGSAG